jgi:hypothetical protein
MMSDDREAIARLSRGRRRSGGFADVYKPVLYCTIGRWHSPVFASIYFAKVRVAGSNPVVRSSYKSSSTWVG